MRPDGPRPAIAGPDTPETPFPVRLSGPVVKGFGRGSKDLGIPTANIPIAGLSVGGHEGLENGIYYGWAGVNVDSQGDRIDKTHKARGGVWAMVMSIGWNPFYKNTVRSVEVHILNTFSRDFYDARMNLVILGFIRPEYDYVSKESLIDDIHFDMHVARNSLERGSYAAFRNEEYLGLYEGEEHEDSKAN